MTRTSAPSINPAEALLGQVAGEFTDRLQRGETPDVEEYARRHPEMAEVLRQVLPALQLMRPEGSADGVSGTLGDYRIVREVGRGGMGVVYEAEQISLGRRVAMKVLPFAATMDPKHLQRFHNEARAAASLHHPHIVPVYAVGCERGVHFYAMQFIDGRTLAEVIAEQRGVSEPRPSGSGVESAPMAAATVSVRDEAVYHRRVAEWGIQAAEALEHAHSLGIVHRDVKPANLLLDGRGQLWVADFGLARSINDAGLTITGDLVGTLGYMSPEQALAKHGLVDHRADVYSLGVTIYELLALAPAFAGADRQQLLGQIAFEEPRRLRLVNGSIPTALETIVSRAMAKEPGDRYPTARELADDLRRFAEGRPIRARRPTWRQRLSKWAARHQAALLTALVTLALAVVTLAASTWRIAVSEGEAVWHRERAEEHARDADEQRRKAQESAATLQLEKALTLCDQGEISRGLLWLARSLEGAVEAEAADLERVIRWNLALWRPRLTTLRACLGHPARVRAVAFADDATLATACEDGVARLWDLSTGRSRDLKFSRYAGIHHLALSADGKMLALGCTADRLWDYDPARRFPRDGLGKPPPTILLWDVAAGELLDTRITPPRPIRELALSPDGRTLAASSWDKVFFWDGRTGKPLDTIQVPAESAVWNMAFSRDGSTLLTGHADRQARFWEVATGKEVGIRLHHPQSGVTAVAFGPEGRSALTSNSFHALLWENGTGKPVGPAMHHRGIVGAAAFSPDGRTLLTGSDDSSARLWHAGTGKPRGQPLMHGGYVQAAAFSRGGRLFATGSTDGAARVWEVPGDRPGGPTLRQGGHIHASQFSPDGRWIATAGGDRTARLWDSATGRPVGEPLRHHDYVTHVAFLDATRLLTVANVNQGAVWEGTTGKRLADYPRAGLALALAVSPDGRLLTGSVDNDHGVRDVQVREAATGKPVGKPLRHEQAVRCMAFSPEGRWVMTGSEAGTARLWETATGEPTGAAMRHRASVEQAKFTPDGQAVWTVTTEGTLRCWDAGTGEPLGPSIEDPDGGKSESIFSPDARLVLTMRGDGTARVRDVRTGRPLGPHLPHWSQARAAAFEPENRKVLTVLPGEEAAQVWDLPPPQEGPAGRIRVWVEVMTGQELNADGVVHTLDPAGWKERERRLESLGR